MNVRVRIHSHMNHKAFFYAVKIIIVRESMKRFIKKSVVNVALPHVQMHTRVQSPTWQPRCKY